MFDIHLNTHIPSMFWSLIERKSLISHKLISISKLIYFGRITNSIKFMLSYYTTSGVFRWLIRINLEIKHCICILYYVILKKWITLFLYWSFILVSIYFKIMRWCKWSKIVVKTLAKCVVVSYPTSSLIVLN
jgi:hypothetical protein